MLTVGQVKKQAEVYLRIEWSVDEETGIEMPTDGRKAMAKLFYHHGGALHELGMMFEAPRGLDCRIAGAELVCRDAIDWSRFTEWLNRHDDIGEGNLLTRDQYRKADHRMITRGRKGVLDTTTRQLHNFNR